MKRDELRSCTVRIGKATESYRSSPDMEKRTRIIKEAEIHKGYFHTWATESYVTNGYMAGTVAWQISSFYGIVEYEDGSVHKVDPESITFADRECKE